MGVESTLAVIGTGGPVKRTSSRTCGVTLRTQWLAMSATIMFPSRSTATPFGSLKSAPDPSPSRYPSAPGDPAS
eukprot:7967128-Pyramimonas_sp.AAC.1